MAKTAKDFADKYLLKTTGIIHEIRSAGNDNILNIIVSRSGGKKFMSFIIFRDKFDVRFKVADRVGIKFTCDAKYVEKYDRWFNSLWIISMEQRRVNEDKLRRQESLAKYEAKRADENASNRSMFNNNYEQEI